MNKHIYGFLFNYYFNSPFKVRPVPFNNYHTFHSTKKKTNLLLAYVMHNKYNIYDNYNYNIILQISIHMQLGPGVSKTNHIIMILKYIINVLCSLYNLAY